MIGRMFAGVAALSLLAGAAMAQDAVKAVVPSEPLFHSKDPKLDRNKQVAYHIERDLLEAGHWDMADKYLTQRYIQHNPNAMSGLPGVIFFFTQVMKVQPKPIPAALGAPVVAVTAEGDLVTVMTRRELKSPKDPSKTYTTTWFDTWRMLDGKADEHWDSAEMSK